MTTRHYLFLVAGMAFVTYLPRWLPLAVLSRRTLPAWFSEWLDFIPVAILSALIVPALFATSEPRTFSLGRAELLAAVPTFVFALKTRSLGGTVLVGMATFYLLGKFL